MSTAAEPTTPPVPPSSPNKAVRKTALDMVRSMAVIVVVVGALFLIVPRVQEVRQPPIDVAAAASGLQAGVEFELAVPANLPDTWKANRADVGPSTDQAVTWHVGWVIDDQRYAEIEQAQDPTPRWIEEQAGGTDRGTTLTIDGEDWQTVIRDEGQPPSLLRDQDGVITIVTGEASDTELEQLAASLEP